MAAEFVLVKSHDGTFHPATSVDAEQSSSWRSGKPVKVKATGWSQRSLAHHRLYFGGLLSLTLDYWEPSGGLIGNSEQKALNLFSDWLDKKSGSDGAIRCACEAFIHELATRRAAKIDTPEKSIQALHQWVKSEAGYYELIMTPAGIRRETKSINFNAMSQDGFNAFYKAAFGVCWRFILSRTFDDEEQAHEAVDQLLSMG